MRRLHFLNPSVSQLLLFVAFVIVALLGTVQAHRSVGDNQIAALGSLSTMTSMYLTLPLQIVRAHLFPSVLSLWTILTVTYLYALAWMFVAAITALGMDQSRRRLPLIVTTLLILLVVSSILPAFFGQSGRTTRTSTLPSLLLLCGIYLSQAITAAIYLVCVIYGFRQLWRLFGSQSR